MTITNQSGLTETTYWDRSPERFNLPSSYHVIAPFVGWDRAVEIGMRVWEVCAPPSRSGGPGRRSRGRMGSLYVPHRINLEAPNRIVQIAGLKDAAKLVAAMPGEQLFFPCIESASITRRNRAIAEQVADGWPTASVAQGFGITARQVRRICAALARATAG
jgi:DNA-binding CsgD family transcriptional regulator